MSARVGIALMSLGGALLGCGASQRPGPAAVVESSRRCTEKAGERGRVKLDVRSGDAAREVVLHVPKTYEPTRGAPVVVAFHFAGGSPELMSLVTRLNDAADERGFIVAYPAGIGGSWNAGKCCGDAWKRGVDDVAFTRDALDAIEERYCVDPDRVYATGMSNGALMAHRAGCELGDRIAAIAPVAGAVDEAPIAAGLGKPCKSRRVSVLAFHGTEDHSIPYEGGTGRPPVPLAGDMDFMSVDETMAVWRGVDGCSQKKSVVYSRGDASCVAWSKCNGGATAELCTIEGGGHTWPGGYMPALFGKTSSDIDASRMMLDFFARH